MSHGHSGRGSCLVRKLGPRLQTGKGQVARGMTDVDVGSGALLGHFLSSLKETHDPLMLLQVLIAGFDITEHAVIDSQRFLRVLLICFRDRLLDRLSFFKPADDLVVVAFFIRRAIADNFRGSVEILSYRVHSMEL